MHSDLTWIDCVRNLKLDYEEIETYFFLWWTSDVSKIYCSCDDQLEEVKGSAKRRNMKSRDGDGEISVVEKWTNRGKVENEYETCLDLDEIWVETLTECANANEYARNDVQGERKSDGVSKFRENEVDEKLNLEESSRLVEGEANDHVKQMEGTLMKSHECSH